MKKLLLIALAGMFCCSFASIAQDFEVPSNYQLEAKEDYAAYEKDVIAASKWLQTVPPNEQTGKRKEVAAFVVRWVTGSPNVTITLYGPLADISKKNPDMLFIYMAAASQYVLESKDNEDEKAKARFALQAMSKVYQAGKGVTKDKKLEKIVKADQENNLDAWIAENFK